MPLHVNRSHWCLAIADISKKEFIFLDPESSTMAKNYMFKKKFERFFKMYTNHKQFVTLSVFNAKLINHILQNDSFNCGALIIYFVQQYCNNRNMTVYEDMCRFRKYLKLMLLKNSDDMQQNCLICGFQCDEDQKYLLCNRLIHNNCIKLNDINQCLLCQNYKPP